LGRTHVLAFLDGRPRSEQIMQQAATAVLAQANMSQQTVLQLLQG